MIAVIVIVCWVQRSWRGHHKLSSWPLSCFTVLYKWHMLGFGIMVLPPSASSGDKNPEQAQAIFGWRGWAAGRDSCCHTSHLFCLRNTIMLSKIFDLWCAKVFSIVHAKAMLNRDHLHVWKCPKYKPVTSKSDISIFQVWHNIDTVWGT